MTLSATDRVLVVAPHPDDESLATGTLIVRALAAGASVTVAFVTSGENNPWAQRAIERRLIIGARDRQRFGTLREAEAAEALRRLGLPSTSARFLRFPDQGLTGALLRAPQPVIAALRAVLDEARPTIIAAPSASDLHPDHSALGVLLRLAVAQGGRSAPHELTYVVHRPGSGGTAHAQVVLQPTPAEAAVKREAVACHRSQMVWRRRWMFAFVEAAEAYFAPAPAPSPMPLPLAARRDPAGNLVVTLDSHTHWRSWGARTLAAVVDHGESGTRTFLCSLRRGARRLHARSATSGDRTTAIRVDGCNLVLPASLVPAAERCFLKLERRYGFFDEGGWLEVLPGESQPE